MSQHCTAVQSLLAASCVPDEWCGVVMSPPLAAADVGAHSRLPVVACSFRTPAGAPLHSITSANHSPPALRMQLRNPLCALNQQRWRQQHHRCANPLFWYCLL
jgi:hypothetical protein